MNRRNDWKGLLKLANEDLEQFGYSILITEPEEGFYDLEICVDGKENETYASNYFESELSDLITEAWHDIKIKLV